MNKSVLFILTAITLFLFDANNVPIPSVNCISLFIPGAVFSKAPNIE
jgi:hypothetical protein